MSFTYQQWKKQESEQRILNTLNDGDRSFSDLLELTELSKPVLSDRLKGLKKQAKIKIVPETETKRFLYQLVYESLDDVEKSFVLIHVLSKYVVMYAAKLARNSSVSDEEYSKQLVQDVSTLFTFRMLAHTIAPGPVKGEWLKTTLGLEFVKMMPKLFPENRNILPHVLDGMSPKEQAIYSSEETEEAAKQVLEYLENIVEKLSKK